MRFRGAASGYDQQSGCEEGKSDHAGKHQARIFLQRYLRAFLSISRKPAQKELPGKKLVLLPYSNYTRAPLNPKWTLPDNVELRVCIFDFPAWTRNREIAAKWQENMNEWYNALGRRPVVSLWLYNVPGNPFARAIAPQLIADVPKVLGKTLGNTELFFDQYGGLEFYYYYANYAGVRGMWNPGFNVDAAIAEHWEPFYGKEAGAYLKQFHKVLFDSYMKYFVPQKERNPLYPVTVINELESLLKKAESSIPPDSIEMKRFRVFAFPWKKAFESQRTVMPMPARFTVHINCFPPKKSLWTANRTKSGTE